MALFFQTGREARLILIISYLLTAGVVLRALGYILQPGSLGALIVLFLCVYLFLLTIEQLAPFAARWQHHLYFLLQTILIASLLLLPPSFDFYAVLFFPLTTQALLNLPRWTGRVWIGIFTLAWTTIFVVTLGLSGLALSLFFAVGAIFFASFGVLTVQTLAANRQLAAYAAQVEDLTIANERQRLARELHDTLAQGLAGLILQLEAADSHLTRGNAGRAQTIIEQAMTRARSTLADARHAIDDLRMTDTSPRDLEEGIRAQVEHFRETTGIPVALDLTTLPTFDMMVSETTLRMVSESFINCSRHAHAQHLWIRVAIENNVLIVSIRDDGEGFDPERVEKQSGHYGLIGLRERAHLAGGELNISSSKGKGTTLVLRLPLERVAIKDHLQPVSIS